MAESLQILDSSFSEWVVRNFSDDLEKKDCELLRRIAEAVSFSFSIKHTCLDFSVYKDIGEPLLLELLSGIKPKDVQRIITPAVKPLVASEDGSRVWLQKYYLFDQCVAQKLQVMRNEGRLQIITGGPGTGKTYTASQYIQEELEKNPKCLVQLAAPTGKAANNMMNALARSKFDAAAYGLKGLTLHSLLGMHGRSSKPRHNKNYPLACDLLVVDEASMIDLPMMYRLLAAMPPHAKLLLLGDKDQLASVEAGSVLADICCAFDGDNCMTLLQESRRFKDSPEIGKLAAALNVGCVPDMTANQSVIYHSLVDGSNQHAGWLEQALAGYRWIAAAIKKKEKPEEILQQQTKFQVLCALREGRFGVAGINRLIAEKLGVKSDGWYIGQPVIVMQNDHQRKLYNGDVGMVLDFNGDKRACFLVNGEAKAISRSQMPEYETCYAITVHKSQGSEYNHVMIVLPDDVSAARANPVLTRELIYTAVTRAKSKIDLWTGDGVLDISAKKTTQRMSGLRHTLCLIGK